MYPNSIYIGLKRSPHVGTLGGSGLWGQSIYYLGTCTLRVQPVHYDAETSWIHCGHRVRTFLGLSIHAKDPQGMCLT